MSTTFKYNVIPNPNGGFSTRAVLGANIEEAALLSEVATAAGTTDEIARAVIQNLFSNLRQRLAGNQWSINLFGEFGIRPTSGGTQTSPEGFNTATEIRADISLTLLSEIIDVWRETLHIESQGTKGFLTPVINSIISEETGVENKYTPLTMIRLVGHDLRLDKSDTTQGVFFIKPDASEVRATTYGPISPSSVIVLVPSGLTGPLQVRITASINGGYRSYLYSFTINNV